MTFNTALTGLRSANTELEVSGNNIANASTVGFKLSRAEFSDVYASTVIGGGSDAVGNGVRVSNIAQQFSQGNIGFTENALDLAINGGGFFVLNDQGTQTFSRAGQFGVDDQGFITSNSGANLQGFASDATGNLSGVLSDLQLDTVSIDPRQTSEVNIGFNLDSTSLVLAERGNSLVSDGAAIGAVQVGTTNGYPAGSIDVNGSTLSIPAAADQPANDIAAALSAIDGVTAQALTTADFSFTGGTTINVGDVQLNGQNISGTNLTEIATSINSLVGLSATLSGGGIEVTATDGANVTFTVNPASGLTVDLDGTTATTGSLTKGGVVSVTLEEGVTLAGVSGGVFTTSPALSPFERNTFDPTNPATYNDATSVSVFDSLGGAHILEMFFVKESTTAVGPNTWSIYAQVDGEDVGDPDPLAADPNAPTQARYTVRFNNDGSLDTINSDPILVSNWTPLDAQGNPNGSLGPANVVSGGALPVPVPATSSNFEIDIAGSTQFAGVFGVNSLDQTGFATGQLSSVDIDETGIIFARYSNGEALVLGQVALADFNNQQGLTPIGDTAWAESFQSGPPVIGAPRSAALGAIQSGALEDSNVDLAEELVALIIAQRNFQANARTIETANEVTQTVINLR